MVGRSQEVIAAAQSGEYNLRLGHGRAFSERLLPCPEPVPRPARSTGQTVLVTGGTQGLGLETAKRLLQRGVTAAVLLSRKGKLDRETLEELAQRDQAVFVAACDVTAAETVGAVMEWTREQLPPLQVFVKASRRLPEGSK